MRGIPRRGFPKVLLSLLGVLVVLVGWSSSPSSSLRAADPLPAQISDDVYWKMVTDMSEKDGYFQFENFLSNEQGFQYVIPTLMQTTKPGGVYLGVGPEQNFTYIAALRPKIVFIIDIRRQNMIELLMYKALFEMSENRADFVSNLFARKRPAGLTDQSTASELFRAFSSVPWDNGIYEKTYREMVDLLTKTHNFGLRPTDLKGDQSIDYVYSTFIEQGPALDYATGGNSQAGRGNPTYEDLMAADDGQGMRRSFLANEENYRLIRDLQKKNLIVPLVGDFAGPKTIRAVGQYLTEHAATVTAFYLSNVEQYLFQNGVAGEFYENVSTLPLDVSSTFIRSFSGGGGGFAGGPFRFESTLSSMTDIVARFKKGQVRTYNELRQISRFQ